MNAQRQNWEDLRLVLAIVRGKGLSGASRLLGLHHATILRRLNSFEQQNGVVLFDRAARGYAPTGAGEELARIAEIAEQEILGAYRQLAGQDLRLSGSIRCATADYIAQYVLPPVLNKFRARYRDIDIEIGVSPFPASLTKRDADVAIRVSQEISDTLVGERAAEIEFGVYGCKSYLEQVSAKSGLDQYDWIGVDDTLSHVSTYQWRTQRFPKAKVRTKFDSLLGILGAVRGGLGVCYLPHFLAQKDANLVCLDVSPDEWKSGLWILCHPDLNHMYRIRAFLKTAEEGLADSVLNQQDQLRGKQPFT